MINIAQETLDFRRLSFALRLSLLMPTFAFLYAPDLLTETIHRIQNALLPKISLDKASVLHLMPVYYRCPPRSTSELLRTL